LPSPVGKPLTEVERWRAILTSPQIWALMAARMLTDPVWYFLQFWMPKYLHSERGLSQTQLTSLWLIFLAADVGFICGGFMSDALVRRGRLPANARRWGDGGGCDGGSAVHRVGASPRRDRIRFRLFHGGGASACRLATCNAALVMDLVSKPLFATAFGFISAGSAFGGIIMNSAVSWAIGHTSYTHCFLFMVLLHPIGMLLILRFARGTQPSL
jgi:ACS family hexuronate transporter-like MFS transporter